MYVERKAELRNVNINVKVKALVERNYNVSLCNSYWAKTEASIEVEELHFDFGDGIIIKISADYITENCLKSGSFWHLILEKLEC